MHAPRAVKGIVGVIIGLAVGYASVVFSFWHSQIALKLVPTLPSLSFWEVIVLDNKTLFWDWLFLVNPLAASAFTIVLSAMAFGFAALIWL